jgi:hypothetical protein
MHHDAVLEVNMAALEFITWILFGAFLSLRLPGPRWIKLASAMLGAVLGGMIGRSLPWQATIGGYSLSALMLSGIAAAMVLEVSVRLARRV